MNCWGGAHGKIGGVVLKKLKLLIKNWNKEKISKFNLNDGLIFQAG